MNHRQRRRKELSRLIDVMQHVQQRQHHALRFHIKIAIDALLGGFGSDFFIHPQHGRFREFGRNMPIHMQQRRNAERVRLPR